MTKRLKQWRTILTTAQTLKKAGLSHLLDKRAIDEAARAWNTCAIGERKGYGPTEAPIVTEDDSLYGSALEAYVFAKANQYESQTITLGADFFYQVSHDLYDEALKTLRKIEKIA